MYYNEDHLKWYFIGQIETAIDKFKWSYSHIAEETIFFFIDRLRQILDNPNEKDFAYIEDARLEKIESDKEYLINFNLNEHVKLHINKFNLLYPDDVELKLIDSGNMIWPRYNIHTLYSEEVRKNNCITLKYNLIALEYLLNNLEFPKGHFTYIYDDTYTVLDNAHENILAGKSTIRSIIDSNYLYYKEYDIDSDLIVVDILKEVIYLLTNNINMIDEQNLIIHLINHFISFFNIKDESEYNKLYISDYLENISQLYFRSDDDTKRLKDFNHKLKRIKE